MSVERLQTGIERFPGKSFVKSQLLFHVLFDTGRPLDSLHSLEVTGQAVETRGVVQSLLSRIMSYAALLRLSILS
jgi:hypothetical protein